MKKKLRGILLPFLLCLTVSLTACGSKTAQSSPSGKDPASSAATGDSWTICWYLCGSNLESFYGCASDDLAEALAVTLPANIRLVIQTGGSYQWHTDGIRAESIQRHVYDSEGFRTADEQSAANMGESETLASFLRFCEENYPADHKAVLFWNHGGGSVTGAAFDETRGYDALTLTEFAEAFGDVYGLSTDEPPFELIGFDTCLMATVDVASTFRSIGHYLVASEELEPGNGWNYTGWLSALADDPSMDGAALGRVICDTFMAGCEEAGTADEATLSVTDLSKVGGLIDIYNSLGDEALLTALDDPEFFASFGREATRSESYGGNTPEQGYTNMVDLGHLVRNSRSILPEHAQAVLDALDECVIYRVHGPYRTEATGLSCFYSYNADLNNFVDYTNVGSSEAFKYLYAFGLVGKLSAAGTEYVSQLAERQAQLPEVPTLSTFDLSTAVRSYVNDSGCPTLALDQDLSDALREVRVRVRQPYIVSTDPLRVDMIACGETDMISKDWESGMFYCHFDGYWAALDNVMLYTEITYSCDEYTLYSMPILLNGTLCNMQVVFERQKTQLAGGGTQTDYDWHILGVREGLDSETGMADKNLIQLQPGDEIVPVYLVMQDIGSPDAEWKYFYQKENAVIYSEDTELDFFGDLGDASFDIEFEMVDSRNQKATSDRFLIQISGYSAYTQLWDDFMAGLNNAVERWR